MELAISVGDLVSFVHRQGDLTYDTSSYGKNRKLEGLRWHRKIQKERKEEWPEYQSEVTVKQSIACGDHLFHLHGRIDGLWMEPTVHLEEIKTFGGEYKALSELSKQNYWAQLRIYGALLGIQEELKQLTLQICYVEQDSGEIFVEVQEQESKELMDFLESTLKSYLNWAITHQKHWNAKVESAKSLSFPYPEFRVGQKKMATLCYQSLVHKKSLLLQAPTGIGKTLATLFPTVKAMGAGKVGQVFYLSSRTSGQMVARESLELLRQSGLKIKDVTITAKSKICFTPGAACDPTECPFAENYFGKVREALNDTFLKVDQWDREKVEEVAREYQLCPFELSLDLALWMDVIICDVNYAFDPRAQLQRFFVEPEEDFVLLVDEAHNLPDRARQMFSASLTKAEFANLSLQISSLFPGLSESVKAVAKLMNDLKDDLGSEDLKTMKQMPEEFFNQLVALRFQMERTLAENREWPQKEDFMQLFFDLSHFLKMADLFDEHFTFVVGGSPRKRFIEIFCLDPGPQLSKVLDAVSSAIFFSATLSPPNYYNRFFSWQKEMAKVALPSPFPQENQLTVVASHIPTTYKKRAASYSPIAELIKESVALKKGNYLVFFPSYRYLQEVAQELAGANFDLIQQNQEMPEEERQEFLQQFFQNQDSERSLVGLAVMGAGFSEGIDYKGDALIGCFVVTVGLPAIGFRQELIKEHFNATDGNGFAYAYQYPGLTKAVQSAGRVIRTMKDRGFVVLIDPRYAEARYRSLIPNWWQVESGFSTSEIVGRIRQFWT